MVILQFNKFIRNKWAWGAVAVLFCVMFVGSDIVANLAGGEGSNGKGAGTLGDEQVSLEEFRAFLADENINNRNVRNQKSAAAVNRDAWQALAAYRVAKLAGIEISNKQLAETIERMFGDEGGFTFEKYASILRMNVGLTPEAFEAYLRRQMMAREGALRTLLTTATWASPMEIDQFVADMTDSFTVRVASFTQDKAKAQAIKLDDAALKKWYNDNTNSLALPERIKIRYVKFDATSTNILAKMSVTEDDMRDFYDANSEKYPSSDTNDVNGVKKFEVVKNEIEKELRQIEAINYFETNVNLRVFGDDAAFENVASRLDAIAKADNLSVQTSGWFTVEGSVVEGFMLPSSRILPGAKNFMEVVAELDESSEQLRYGIVSSDRAVWLIEKAEVSAAHMPTFEESSEKIMPRALRDARADAFKSEVEAVAAKGVAEVLKTKDVTTNITFCVSDMQGATFDNQMYVVRAATKLKAGEMSKFTLTSPGKAILVVCEKRETGDAAKAVMMRTQVRDQAAMMQYQSLSKKWLDWNLNRLNLKTTDATTIEESSDAEAEVE